MKKTNADNVNKKEMQVQKMFAPIITMLAKKQVNTVIKYKNTNYKKRRDFQCSHNANQNIAKIIHVSERYNFIGKIVPFIRSEGKK